MRQRGTDASRSRPLLVIAAVSVIALGASGPIYSAVRGSHVTRHTAAANASTAGSSYRTYRLRWPSLPLRSATYHLRFKSRHLRAMSLRVYGIAVPRGFDFDFIVACEHRGPAVLDWNWTQSGGYVRITIKMTMGTCDPPGPTVAGRSAALTFRLVT